MSDVNFNETIIDPSLEEKLCPICDIFIFQGNGPHTRLDCAKKLAESSTSRSDDYNVHLLRMAILLLCGEPAHIVQDVQDRYRND